MALFEFEFVVTFTDGYAHTFLSLCDDAKQAAEVLATNLQPEYAQFYDGHDPREAVSVTVTQKRRYP